MTDLRPPGTRVDHYELVAHLADGAQAEVHRAVDVRTGRDVVIKFPHARTLDNPVLAARWRREAALTEQLSHPGLQCRLDVGERHQEPYVVVEYAGGGTVRDWLRSSPAGLPVAQVVTWARQLALALAYLHERGIVHRDLKPDNLLVTDDMTIKLGDFGAAVRVRNRRRWWQMPLPPEGTADYLSPEIITGRPFDGRADLYSWGTVVYELLTGHPPFGGKDDTAIMQAHLVESPAPLTSWRGDVPPGLQAIVMKTLRRAPASRYATAVDLVDDLDHLESLDLTSFDHAPDAPMRDLLGGAELRAFVRLALTIATTFVGAVALIILVTALVR